tara:strand:+ start:1644 stop:2858 length:1215 start_codon:yes stop_codon:yes gene_type:complete
LKHNKTEILVASSSSDWSDEIWSDWDKVLISNPSAYLASKSIKAALDVPHRKLQAVRWIDEKGSTIGVAQIEDSYALSQSQGQFLKADKPIFKLAQKYLYRGDGIFQFSVRVMGTVLSSGDHAYRFTDAFPESEHQNALHEAMKIKCIDSTEPPKSSLIKDHYSDRPWTEKFAGRSQWHKDWIDLEFDPVMEVELNPNWKNFGDYTTALRKKPRTKIRRILRGSEEMKLKNLTLNEVQAYSQDLHALYTQVYDRAGFKLGRLYPEDIVELKRQWGDNFPVIAYYLDDELVGFQCGITTKSCTEAFFVGFSIEENKIHSIYQRMLLEFIIQAISTRSKRISLGRTALDIKSSIGACPKRLVCHMRADRPLVHALTKVIARASSPKIPQLKRAWDEESVSILADSI